MHFFLGDNLIFFNPTWMNLHYEASETVSRRNVGGKRNFRTNETANTLFSRPSGVTWKRKGRLTAFNLKCWMFKEHYAAAIRRARRGCPMKLLRTLFRIDVRADTTYSVGPVYEGQLLRVSSVQIATPTVINVLRCLNKTHALTQYKSSAKCKGVE